jgi:hypothetical protein
MKVSISIGSKHYNIVDIDDSNITLFNNFDFNFNSDFSAKLTIMNYDVDVEISEAYLIFETIILKGFVKIIEKYRKNNSIFTVIEFNSEKNILLSKNDIDQNIYADLGLIKYSVDEIQNNNNPLYDWFLIDYGYNLKQLTYIKNDVEITYNNINDVEFTDNIKASFFLPCANIKKLLEQYGFNFELYYNEDFDKHYLSFSNSNFLQTAPDNDTDIFEGDAWENQTFYQNIAYVRFNKIIDIYNMYSNNFTFENKINGKLFFQFLEMTYTIDWSGVDYTNLFAPSIYVENDNGEMKYKIVFLENQEHFDIYKADYETGFDTYENKNYIIVDGIKSYIIIDSVANGSFEFLGGGDIQTFGIGEQLIVRAVGVQINDGFDTVTLTINSGTLKIRMVENFDNTRPAPNIDQTSFFLSENLPKITLREFIKEVCIFFNMFVKIENGKMILTDKINLNYIDLTSRVDNNSIRILDEPYIQNLKFKENETFFGNSERLYYSYNSKLFFESKFSKYTIKDLNDTSLSSDNTIKIDELNIPTLCLYENFDGSGESNKLEKRNYSENLNTFRKGRLGFDPSILIKKSFNVSSGFTILNQKITKINTFTTLRELELINIDTNNYLITNKLTSNFINVFNHRSNDSNIVVEVDSYLNHFELKKNIAYLDQTKKYYFIRKFENVSLLKNSKIKLTLYQIDNEMFSDLPRFDLINENLEYFLINGGLNDLYLNSEVVINGGLDDNYTSNEIIIRG